MVPSVAKMPICFVCVILPIISEVGRITPSTRLCASTLYFAGGTDITSEVRTELLRLDAIEAPIKK